MMFSLWLNVMMQAQELVSIPPAFPPSGTGVVISNGSSYIAGERDAGIVLTPETNEPLLYVFGSYEGST